MEKHLHDPDYRTIVHIGAPFEGDAPWEIHKDVNK
jgi:hypothetical protein